MVNRFFNFILLVLAFLCVSCSNREYINSLPKEAQLVLSVNPESLFQKADISDISSFPQYLQVLLDSPEKVGVDWTKDIYFYLSDNNMGFVAAMNDADRLTDFLEQNAQEFNIHVESDGDYYWAYTDMLLIGYNDDQLLSMTIYGDAKVFRQKAKKLMKQDVGDSFASSSSFVKLVSAKSDFAIYADATALPENLLGKWLDFLPKNVDLNSLSLLLSANMEKGKLLANAEFFSNDAKIQKAILDLASSMKKQGDTYINAVPENFTIYGSLGCTPQLIDLLKQNQGIGMTLALLDQVVPASDLFQKMNGDISFFLQGSDYMLYAQLDDTSIFDNDSWAHHNGIRTRGKHIYSFDNYTFGLKEDSFFITNNSSLAELNPAFVSNAATSWKDVQKDSFGFLLLNLPKVEALSVLPSNLRLQFEQAVLLWKEPTKFEITVTMKNQDENILKTLLNSWMK